MKNKFLHVVIAAIGMFLVSSPACADVSRQMLAFKCDDERGGVTIHPFIQWNENLVYQESGNTVFCVF